MSDNKIQEKPILDLTFIEELRMLDDNIVIELIDTFFDFVPKEIQAIQVAYTAKDYNTVRRKAHSLKSSAGNLGGARFSSLCLAIESNQEDDLFGNLLSLMNGEFLQLKTELEKERKSNP